MLLYTEELARSAMQEENGTSYLRALDYCCDNLSLTVYMSGTFATKRIYRPPTDRPTDA
jgi:hypothetical protein